MVVNLQKITFLKDSKLHWSSNELFGDEQCAEVYVDLYRQKYPYSSVYVSSDIRYIRVNIKFADKADEADFILRESSESDNL